MTDFAMLDQVLVDLQDPKTQKTGEKTVTNPNQKISITCAHENVINEKSRCICTDCGKEVHVKRNKNFDKFNVNRNKLDPNRCQIRKSDEKTIHKDVEKMNFSDAIIVLANKIFLETTKGNIYKGNSRRAIIFACVFHAYKITGTPQSCESLIEVFQLNRKVGLKGLKHVGINAPKNSLIRTTHITPQDLVREIMKKFEAMVLSCMDPRFQPKVFNYLKKKKLNGKYSSFTIAGAAIGVTSRKFKKWQSTFLYNLSTSIKLHNINKLIIINHEASGESK